jgi:hypothetical protein
MPPHILAVFNQLFDELKSMKQQQWAITNYGLLILGAIYAVKLSGIPHSQTYLKILVGATAVLGSGFLLRVQYNMVATRYRLDHMHNKFLYQTNLRTLAGLIRRYGDFSTDPGGASWHIGAEAWSLPCLSFLSCWVAQSSCIWLCSHASKLKKGID